MNTNQKKIIQSLSDGHFHSGSDLADALNMSRSAICNHIKKLEDYGIEINAVSGKGYKLHHPLELLAEESIRLLLHAETQANIEKLEVFDCIDSTNSYLVEKSRQLNQLESEKGAYICLSEYQQQGRGRMGRNWVSPYGQNIYLSILWFYKQDLSELNGLSLAVGVAVVRAIEELGVESIGLKWPNDIYFQKKKLGGILIEAQGEFGSKCSVVMGLGLNLNMSDRQAASIDQDWVNLDQIMPGQIYLKRNLLVASLLNQLVPLIAGYSKDGLDSILDEWRAYDCLSGQVVDLYQGDNKISGLIQGINDQGMLLFADEDGITRTFASGEVSFRAS